MIFYSFSKITVYTGARNERNLVLYSLKTRNNVQLMDLECGSYVHFVPLKKNWAILVPWSVGPNCWSICVVTIENDPEVFLVMVDWGGPLDHYGLFW